VTEKTRFGAVRGRLEVIGPTTAADIADTFGLPAADVDFALAGLEHEGFAAARPLLLGVEGTEWCERRLLARIHRYTLDRLRKEIEPVNGRDFLRFLFKWQRLATGRARRDRRAWQPCSMCSTATSWQPARGSPTCCRRGSPTMTRSGSTGCACRARSRGDG